MTEEELKKAQDDLKKEKEQFEQEKASAKAAGDIDTSKLTEDQVLKVLEDPRLWKSKRLTELREKAKKAEELETLEAKQKEEDQKKKGEYDQLLKQKDEEITTLKEQSRQIKIEGAIAAAAQKLGAVDQSVVGKLIDKSGINIGEDGTVSGVEEAITGLLTAHPYLKGNGQAPTVGTPSNPGEDTQSPKSFKASEINDPTFFREHEKEITEAASKGLIEDDTPTQS